MNSFLRALNSGSPKAARASNSKYSLEATFLTVSATCAFPFKSSEMANIMLIYRQTMISSRVSVSKV